MTKKTEATSIDYTTDRIALARLHADLMMHRDVLVNEVAKCRQRARKLDSTYNGHPLAHSDSPTAQLFIERATEYQLLVFEIEKLDAKVERELGFERGRPGRVPLDAVLPDGTTVGDAEKEAYS